MRQISWIVVLAVGVSTGLASGESRCAEVESGYGVVETYRQILTIEAAADADALPVPKLAPVYDGHAWALSTRWDDSNPNALNVRRKMLENGIRGTFYLNSRKPEQQAGSLAYTLAGQGECSVGGHSVSHPHLPKLPANEVFYELMANRITLECLTDCPVNSLAFPFGGYQDPQRLEVLQGVTEAFLRTGYHHCVYARFVTNNEFLPANLVSTGLQVVPGDRQVDAEKFWPQIEKIRKFASGFRQTSDCIFLGVHPWQEGQELERLGRVMGELRDWDDFWHCTQTEYAAFVKQRRNTNVESLSQGEFAIERPCAFDVGNAIPLTLVFDSDTVRSAKIDGVTCPVRRARGKSFVNVPHATGSGVPRKIDQTVDGLSGKFPGLKASLQFDPATGKMAYQLENTTGHALSHGSLTVSTPPAFEPGMLRWQHAQLASGETWPVTVDVTGRRDGDYWRGGKYYLAAQLDFIANGQRGRLFTTCTVD